MFNKKSQMDIRELIITIVIAGILFIVGLLIFANISNTAENILDPTQVTVRNETFTFTLDDVGIGNTTTLAQLGFITASDKVVNVSGDQDLLVRDTDYRITLFDGASGDFKVQANFTLINNDDITGFNASLLSISYNRNIQSAAQASTQTIQSTVLDSFELGVIALIVLAAVVILAVLFRLGQ